MQQIDSIHSLNINSETPDLLSKRPAHMLYAT